MAIVENPSEVTECGGKKWPSGALFAEAADALVFDSNGTNGSFSQTEEAPPSSAGSRAWLEHLQLLFHPTHHMTAAELALLVKRVFNW